MLTTKPTDVEDDEAGAWPRDGRLPRQAPRTRSRAATPSMPPRLMSELSTHALLVRFDQLATAGASVGWNYGAGADGRADLPQQVVRRRRAAHRLLFTTTRTPRPPSATPPTGHAWTLVNVLALVTVVGFLPPQTVSRAGVRLESAAIPPPVRDVGPCRPNMTRGAMGRGQQAAGRTRTSDAGRTPDDAFRLPARRT